MKLSLASWSLLFFLFSLANLMSEIEEVLKIDAVPVNWPIGAGHEFRGVYDRIDARSLYFAGGKHGTQKVEQRAVAGAPEDAGVRDALALLDGAGARCSAPTPCARGVRRRCSSAAR